MSCEIASGPPGKVQSEPGKYSRPRFSRAFMSYLLCSQHTSTTSRLTTIIIEDWILFEHTSMGINAENVTVLLINNTTLKPEGIIILCNDIDVAPI